MSWNRYMTSYDLAVERQQALRDGDRAAAREIADELDRRAAERRDKRRKIKIDAEAAE